MISRKTPIQKEKPIIKSEQRDDLKFMLTKSHVFGSEIPEWRKMSNKPVSLAATHREEGRPLRNLPARHFCRELLGLFHLFFFLTFQSGHFSRFWPPCEWYFGAFCSCVFNCLSLIWVFSLSCHFSCSVYFVFNCLLLLVLLCVFFLPILVFPCVFNLLPVLSTLHCTDNGAWQPWGQAPRHGQTCILSDFLRKTPRSNY